MRYVGKFIGVNKHSDPDIRDLNGAVKDATALWALFSDNIPEIQAELLIDEDATAEKIQAAICDSLAQATEDDVLIISFSGHGSEDHHLVAHDTDLNNFLKTSIPMGVVAESFRSSKARSILFFLDCCFSGDATSKVLEGSPVSRSYENPFKKFDGRGRILLAAANYDEAAYELPSNGHGILTKAIVEVLLKSESITSVSEVVDEIMKRVRSEANRIGREQTPAVIGHIEGGLNLGKFEMGEKYLEAFPDRAGLHVSSDISELASFGIPNECLSAWIAKFKSGLNELQIQSINEFRILEGKSLFVIAPTSSGKTFIGEMSAIKKIAIGNKAVFLFPYKALVNEKFDYFSELYGEQLGARIIRCTGDYTDQASAFLKGKYDIAIFTYELFLSLLITNRNALNQIGIIVLDEAQFITDPNRGIIVELILTLLISARERGIDPQIIALSAVVGSVNSFDTWLGIQSLVTFKRPVPLIEGVLDRSGAFKYLDVDGSQKTEQLLSRGSVVQRGKEPSSQDVIVPLVKHLKKTDAKIIVFRNRRGPAEGCAAYLAKELGLPPADSVLAELPQNGLSNASIKLRDCLRGGTAFHSTNLSRQEKEAVEAGYRVPTGEIQVLASTTTLAAGINTPASTVILGEQEFVGPDGRPFTIAEYKNMAGRAGRLGFNEKGKSIILAETPMLREQLFNRYVMGKPEPITSSFQTDDIDEWVIRLLAQIEKIPKVELIGMVCNTYGGFLTTRNHPGWKKQTELHLSDVVSQMIELGLIDVDGENIQLSLLGRICGNASLPLKSSMDLVTILKNRVSYSLSSLKLMILLQVLSDDVMGYVPIFKRGVKDTGWSGLAARTFGNDVVQTLQFGVQNNFDYEARCKKACILWDWISGAPIDQIETKFTKNPFNNVGSGDVTRIAEITRFHLPSFFEITSVVFPAISLDREGHDNLIRRLEFGIPENLISLLDLDLDLTRGDLLLLSQNGVLSSEAFWGLSESKLKTMFGERASGFLETRGNDNDF